MARVDHKRQHIVSQAYLKSWADPATPNDHEPYVWLISRDRSKVQKKAPKNILHETDFYTVFGDTDFRNVALEKKLSEIESNFVRIRDRKIFLHETLTKEDMDNIVLFVATSYARTKLNKDTQSEIWRDYSQLMRTINPRYDRSELQESVRKLRKQPMPYFLNHFLQLVLPYLMTMNLSIISVSDQNGFITSDNPVIWIDPSLFVPGAPISFFGVQSLELNVMMPISPTMVIILSREYLHGYGVIDKPGYSDELNAMMVTFADKWLVNSSRNVEDYWFQTL